MAGDKSTPKSRVRPTADEVRAILAYEPEAGRLTWRITSGRAIAGHEAGGVDKSTGYRRVRCCGGLWIEHHLVWLWHTGEWPERLDHVNGHKDDNRIENLRECTQSQNMANQRRPDNNKSGFKGVHFSKAAGKYVAQIRVLGAHKHLGVFDTAELAHAAYLDEAKKAFGEFACDGDRMLPSLKSKALPKRRKKGRPTPEEVRAALHYEPSTGILKWGENGPIAGQLTHDGYIRIGLFWSHYGAHILAFVIMIGRWPAPRMIIHHRNAVRSDNRWGNLEECTQQQNVIYAYDRLRVPRKHRPSFDEWLKEPDRQ